MREKYNHIIKFLFEYLVTSSCNGYVLNISGGKDSTVVAKLLVDSVGSDKVFGILQPCGEQSDIEDAIKICNLLNIKYTIINIEDTYNSIINNIESNFTQISVKSKINISPRIRMINAYAVAQSLGYLVVGTGNKSERTIGWFTKWGDGACDINPIAHLTCTEVIELGDYLKLPHYLIHKAPADGLTEKSDEDNFGFTYSQLDDFINTFEYSPLKAFNKYPNIKDNIMARFNSSRHKNTVSIIK